MKKFGYSKGAIKKATEAAIRQWAAIESGMKLGSPAVGKRGKTGVDLLAGLLKNTKHGNSVEEQHNIRKLWVKAAAERGRRK